MTSRNIFGILFKSLLTAVFAVCITVGTVGCSQNEGCACGGKGDTCCTKKADCSKKPCAKTCTKDKKAPQKPASIKDATKKSNVQG